MGQSFRQPSFRIEINARAQPDPLMGDLVSQHVLGDPIECAREQYVLMREEPGRQPNDAVGGKGVTVRTWVLDDGERRPRIGAIASAVVGQDIESHRGDKAGFPFVMGKIEDLDVRCALNSVTLVVTANSQGERSTR